jgi:hypothetical protein
MAYATAPSHKATVEKFGDKWTEPGNIRATDVCPESWDHNKQPTLKKNPSTSRKTRSSLRR